MEPLTATIIKAKMAWSHEMSAPGNIFMNISKILFKLFSNILTLDFFLGFAFSRTTLNVDRPNMTPSQKSASLAERTDVHNPRLSETMFSASITSKTNVQNVSKNYENFTIILKSN